ncbi:hypothetical protein RHODO2019_12875 [Rhodococcus antarcticus]|uniref:Uncharacterized protein n=1 Tax=Rhodococcus antarcticus TaxID=2987751 RepID=A0ABY6NXF6_9NOCA|nr:hypothetical protein [Rhodococcus antarcticus]UZJ24061.1 hypothetical protein RHODO2019_12875 [Rhodococcus antarcticus]
MTDQPDDQRPAEPGSGSGALNFGYRDVDGRQVASSEATQVVSRSTTSGPAAEPGAADRTQVVPRGTTPPGPSVWGAQPQQQPAPPPAWAAPAGRTAPDPQWEKARPALPQAPQGHGQAPRPGHGPPTRSGHGQAPQGPWPAPQAWNQAPLGYGPPPQPGWGRPAQAPVGHQQPYQGQQWAPVQPGWGRLVVDTSFFPLAFVLYLFGPLVTVDGQERGRTWGRVAIDVPAGQHRVDVLTRYLFPIAQASLDVVVQPGQEVPVFYRTPAIIFMSGSIGHVPQGTKGLLLMVVLPLGILGLVLLLLLLVVVVGR